MGHQEPLLLVVKHQKLAWVELVTCHDNLSKVILHGIVENGLRCGGQRKSCNDHRNNLGGCRSPPTVPVGEASEMCRSSIGDASIMIHQ